jgi:hypothetical protein
LIILSFNGYVKDKRQDRSGVTLLKQMPFFHSFHSLNLWVPSSLITLLEEVKGRLKEESVSDDWQ